MVTPQELWNTGNRKLHQAIMPFVGWNPNKYFNKWATCLPMLGKHRSQVGQAACPTWADFTLNRCPIFLFIDIHGFRNCTAHISICIHWRHGYAYVSCWFLKRQKLMASLKQKSVIRTFNGILHAPLVLMTDFEKNVSSVYNLIPLNVAERTQHSPIAFAFSISSCISGSRSLATLLSSTCLLYTSPSPRD